MERSKLGHTSDDVLTRTLDRDLIRALDLWVSTRSDPKPSRVDAIRSIVMDRLIQDGLARSDTSLASQIVERRTAIEEMPVHDSPSPSAGLAAMDKAVAENELVGLANEQTRRRRVRAKGGR